MQLPTNPVDFLIAACNVVSNWNAAVKGTDFGGWCFPLYEPYSATDNSKRPRPVLKSFETLHKLGHFRYSKAITSEARKLEASGKRESLAYYLATVRAGVKSGKLEEGKLKSGWRLRDASREDPEERPSRSRKPEATVSDIAESFGF